MTPRRNAALILVLILYVMSSAIALVVWAGQAVQTPRRVLFVASALSAFLAVVLVGAIVYALLVELLTARQEAADRGEPIPGVLVGLMVIYSLALFVMLYRAAIYAAFPLGQDGIVQAMIDPDAGMAVNTITLLFVVFSYAYLARPQPLTNLRRAWQWVRAHLRRNR